MVNMLAATTISDHRKFPAGTMDAPTVREILQRSIPEKETDGHEQAGKRDTFPSFGAANSRAISPRACSKRAMLFFTLQALINLVAQLEIGTRVVRKENEIECLCPPMANLVVLAGEVGFSFEKTWQFRGLGSISKNRKDSPPWEKFVWRIRVKRRECGGKNTAFSSNGTETVVRARLAGTTVP